MIILTLRTDKPESEIGLYQKATPLAYHHWHANRQLAETIHRVIEEQLSLQKINYEDLKGIVFYKGPGSFTGLRIGASVANALASSLGISIIGSNGDNWKEQGINSLLENQNDGIVVPEYGALPNVTIQKK